VKRVFLEAQGWWGERQSDGTVPKYGAAEHIHVGMCFPLKQTVSGMQTMRVRVMGHNLPVGAVIKSTNLHDPDGGSFANISWNRKVLASDNHTIEMWRTVSFNTVLPGHESGLREFRVLTIVTRPNNAEIHSSSGWCWQVANGGTNLDSGTCVDTPNSTMGRGWYDCFEYKIAETRAPWTYPWSGITRGANYSVTIGGRDGAGLDTRVTGWEVRLDPDFHAVPENRGSLVASGSGSAFGVSVNVLGSLLTGPKVHKLVVIAFANPNPAKCTATGPDGGIVPQDGEVSAVFAIPIKVN
jgi:hypothetical protein